MVFFQQMKGNLRGTDTSEIVGKVRKMKDNEKNLSKCCNWSMKTFAISDEFNVNLVYLLI